MTKTFASGKSGWGKQGKQILNANNKIQLTILPFKSLGSVRFFKNVFEKKSHVHSRLHLFNEKYNKKEKQTTDPKPLNSSVYN